MSPSSRNAKDAVPDEAERGLEAHLGVLL
jgi:hypothetical protein